MHRAARTRRRPSWARSSDADLVGVLEAARATGRAGEVTALPVPAGVAGAPDLRSRAAGRTRPGTRDDFRRAGAAAARAVDRPRHRGHHDPGGRSRGSGSSRSSVGAVLGSFAFEWRSTARRAVPAGQQVVLAELTDGRRGRRRAGASAVAGASWRSRMLAWVPANLKTPAWLADQAVAAAEEAGLKVTVWDESGSRRRASAASSAVGQASANPPRLVRLDYTPDRQPVGPRTQAPVVLVGKGITFDTGGISIKPGEAMANMKRDMTGGGAVIATMAALRRRSAARCPSSGWWRPPRTRSPATRCAPAT